MARCLDCGKRLFPIINNYRCGPCLEAYTRAEAEKNYAAACRRRDELNSANLLVRAACGAWRGALAGLLLMVAVAIGIFALLGEREGPGPSNRLQWVYFGWWLVLSAAGVGAVYLVAQFRPVPNPLTWAVAVPPVVAGVLGAQFGVRRAVRRDWSWWLNLDPPEHLR